MREGDYIRDSPVIFSSTIISSVCALLAVKAATLVFTLSWRNRPVVTGTR
jgi:hypothetical protein